MENSILRRLLLAPKFVEPIRDTPLDLSVKKTPNNKPELINKRKSIKKRKQFICERNLVILSYQRKELLKELNKLESKIQVYKAFLLERGNTK